jgi:hypothetical protein
MPPKITSMRLSEDELAFFDEVAERLRINRSEAVRLALYALKERMGLLEEDTVDLQERIARMHGDHAVLRFEINSVEAQEVAVTIDGDPVPEFRANIVYALESPTGTILARDERTGTWYDVGRVALDRGAVVDVPLRRMPDLLQSRADDQRTPEERRTAARMNSLLRQLSRESRGETEDE